MKRRRTEWKKRGRIAQVGRGGSAKAGFSLIEVALALVAACTGVMAAFSLFPASLRQSMESRADLVESSFASAVLETIAGNVRQIDDIATWNDPDEWWSIAVDSAFGDGLTDYAKPKEFKEGFENGRQQVKGFSLATIQVAENYDASMDKYRENRYCGRERTAETQKAAPDKIQEPAQWLLRLTILKRPALSERNEVSDTQIPNRYLVAVVSTPIPSPERYTQNAVFAREFFFEHRP